LSNLVQSGLQEELSRFDKLCYSMGQDTGPEANFVYMVPDGLVGRQRLARRSGRVDVVRMGIAELQKVYPDLTRKQIFEKIWEGKESLEWDSFCDEQELRRGLGLGCQEAETVTSG